MTNEIERWRSFVVDHNANRYLALFVKTGNGLLIWRAYQEYRRLSLAVPEAILKKLNQYADRLLSCDDPDLLRALDLAFNERGGAGPRADLKVEQRSRDIVEPVRILNKSADCSLSDAYRAAAK